MSFRSINYYIRYTYEILSFMRSVFQQVISISETAVKYLTVLNIETVETSTAAVFQSNVLLSKLPGKKLETRKKKSPLSDQLHGLRIRGNPLGIFSQITLVQL